MRQVARHRTVHRCFGIFELGFVQEFDILGLLLIGTGEEVGLIAVFGHHVDKVGEELLAEKYLALAVLDVVLQIESDGFGGAEILHGFGNGLAKFLGHTEEMVNRILAVEYNSRMFTDVDAAFAKFRNADAFNGEKLVEGKLHVEVVDKCFVG